MAEQVYYLYIFCSETFLSRLSQIHSSAGSEAHNEAESRTDLGSSTFETIDEEIRRLVSGAQETAVELLKAHEATLHEAARVLQEKEAITGNEIREIIRRVEGSAPDGEKPAEPASDVSSEDDKA